jgi:hypothetical protein
MKIRKGMYGLPQAGILANKLLKKCLATHSYFKQPHTPGLFSHKSRPIWFNLVVDDLARTPYSTLMILSGLKLTKLSRAALEIDTVESTSSGITSRDMSTSQCSNMS